MLHNKFHSVKITVKRVLHKVRKFWVTVSVALLGILGIKGAATTVNANAANVNAHNGDDQTNHQLGTHQALKSSAATLVKSNGMQLSAQPSSSNGEPVSTLKVSSDSASESSTPSDYFNDYLTNVQQASTYSALNHNEYDLSSSLLDHDRPTTDINYQQDASDFSQQLNDRIMGVTQRLASADAQVHEWLGTAPSDSSASQSSESFVASGSQASSSVNVRASSHNDSLVYHPLASTSVEQNSSSVTQTSSQSGSQSSSQNSIFVSSVAESSSVDKSSSSVTASSQALSSISSSRSSSITSISGTNTTLSFDAASAASVIAHDETLIIGYLNNIHNNRYASSIIASGASVITSADASMILAEATHASATASSALSIANRTISNAHVVAGLAKLVSNVAVKHTLMMSQATSTASSAQSNVSNSGMPTSSATSIITSASAVASNNLNSLLNDASVTSSQAMAALAQVKSADVQARSAVKMLQQPVASRPSSISSVQTSASHQASASQNPAGRQPIVRLPHLTNNKVSQTQSIDEILATLGIIVNTLNKEMHSK